MIGTFSMVQQALILREFFIIAHGNELSWGICLGNWLLGVFLGSWLGGIFLHRRRPYTHFIPALCLLSLVPLPLLFITRSIHWINATPYGAYLTLFQVFLFSALVTIPVSFFIGCLFPLMGQLSGTESGRPSLSSLYALEACGSFSGGLLFTLFFIGRIPPVLLSLILTLLFLFLILYYSWRHGSNKEKAGVFLLILLVLGPALTRGFQWLDKESERLRWQRISPGDLVEARETEYQNLQLGEESGQWHLYANGQLQTVFPDISDSRVLAFHLLCQNPRSRSLLIIGGGLSGLVQSLMIPGVQRITVIESDPQLISLLRRRLPPELSRPLNDPRLNILTGDARRILRRKTAGEAFDTAYIDLPPPATTQLNRFHTLEFYSLLRQSLGPAGMLAVNLLPMETYSAGESGRYNALIFHTLKKLFNEIVISTGPRPILFASGTPGIVSASPAILAERFAAYHLRPVNLARLFPYLHEPGANRTFIKRLDQFDKTINLDNRPLGYYLYNRLIGWYSGSGIAPILNILENAGGRLWLIPLLIAVIPMGAIRVFAGSCNSIRFILRWSAALAGFACMTLEVLLIHLFQNRFGIVYHTIGIIVACFMAGVAVGAAATPKAAIVKDLRPMQTSRLCLRFLMISIPAFILPMIRNALFLNPVMILFLVFFTGFSLGGFIPTAIRLDCSRSVPTASAAGAINAADHLGSACGAFLSAVIFLPLLGFSGTAYLIMGISLSAALFLWPPFAYFVPER